MISALIGNPGESETRMPRGTGGLGAPSIFRQYVKTMIIEIFFIWDGGVPTETVIIWGFIMRRGFMQSMYFISKERRPFCPAAAV